MPRLLRVFAACCTFGLACCLTHEWAWAEGQPAALTPAGVDQQVASSLSKIESTLVENDKVSFPELGQMLVSAGALLPTASLQGRQLMQQLPARLRRHTDELREMHPLRSTNLSVFADAAEQFIDAALVAQWATNQTAEKIPVVTAVPMADPSKPSSPPPTREQESTAANSSQRMLLDRGDAMLGLGDISAARLLFARAADSGIAIAAFKLAETYDPAYIKERNLLGLKPDPVAAIAWYRKALIWGKAEAQSRLNELERLSTP